MPHDGPFSYDQVLYPGHAYNQTHPDRLATLATLHGMSPGPVARCRVLELGCGVGANLVPMAYQLPDSEFVGVDLSDRAVETGTASIAGLGLTNVRLLRRDLMDITPELGTFDYIIAHGVYSWVPAPVRERMLAILRAHLEPQGVGYLSYNCYPGSHLRNIARDVMLFHARDITDPRERVRQSRAALKAVFEASAQDELYGVVLRDQFERVRKMPDPVLFHDDLDAGSVPFLLANVVDDAARHGLQYLSEATFSHSHLGGHSEKAFALLDQMPPSAVVVREQYLDFITGRGFRETLLCHGDLVLRREIDPGCVRNYHLAGFAALVPPEAGAAASEVATFRTDRGRSISTDHPLSKSALLHLGSIWPGATGFADLVDSARRTAPDRDEDVEALTTLLFRAFRAGHIELHVCPPRLTTSISERPNASLLARRQAETGPLVTNLRHCAVMMEDEITRKFLPLVDGTRTVDELAAALRAALAPAPGAGGGGDQGSGKEVTRENVERNLKMLGALGLLVA